MPKRSRRKGFDYFVDKYELSYLDDKDNEYYDDIYIDEEEYYPNQRPIRQERQVIDRFAKTNKYTGDVAGKNYYFENTIYERPNGPYSNFNNADQYNRNFNDKNQYNNYDQKRAMYNQNQGGTIEYGQNRNMYSQNQGGTIEFSAVPGQGGLNPEKRPLGDDTMMFANVATTSSTLPAKQVTNPHLMKLLETQQLQISQSQIYQNEMERKMSNINAQMNSLSNKLDDVSKAITLNNNSNNTSTLAFNNTQQSNTSINQLPNNNDNYQQNFTGQIPIGNVNDSNINKELTQELSAINSNINKISNSTIEIQNEINDQNQKNNKDKKKLSKLAITGIVIWVIIIIGLIVVSILLFLGIIKF